MRYGAYFFDYLTIFFFGSVRLGYREASRTKSIHWLYKLINFFVLCLCLFALNKICESGFQRLTSRFTFTIACFFEFVAQLFLLIEIPNWDSIKWLLGVQLIRQNQSYKIPRAGELFCVYCSVELLFNCCIENFEAKFKLFFYWIYKLVLGSNHDFEVVVWIIVTTVIYCDIYPTAPEVILVHMQVKWNVEQIVERKRKKMKIYHSTSHFNLNKSLMRKISSHQWKKKIIHDSHKIVRMNVFPIFKCFIENTSKSSDHDNWKLTL